MIEITTRVGRLVSGHPMNSQVKKNTDGTPKMMKDGITPQVSFYSGLAIKKGTEQHWNQTEWGAQIWNEAKAAFPNGEFNAPTFAWKIDDGDSQIPNKKGKKPCEREGWTGHWVLHVSNGFPFSCYHDGKFNPFEAIQNKDEIKTGDYCQFVFEVRGNNVNGPTESPGVYLNPTLFNLVRPGQKIVSVNEPDATEKFGTGGAALPEGALVDNNVAAPPPNTDGPGTAPPTPATDFVQGAGATPPPAPPVQELNVNVGGKIYTVSALRDAGWSDDQIKPYLDDIPF